MELLAEDPTPRRFVLIRTIDASGISGTGRVASGVVWPDGVAALHWNTAVNSTTIFQSIDDLIALHGHNGATQVEYVDQ